MEKESVNVEGEFKWNDKLSVGEATIDSQHKRLLDYTNKLIGRPIPGHKAASSILLAERPKRCVTLEQLNKARST
jgi:hypothetical protein